MSETRLVAISGEQVERLREIGNAAVTLSTQAASVSEARPLLERAEFFAALVTAYEEAEPIKEDTDAPDTFRETVKRLRDELRDSARDLAPGTTKGNLVFYADRLTAILDAHPDQEEEVCDFVPDAELRGNIECMCCGNEHPEADVDYSGCPDCRPDPEQEKRDDYSEWQAHQEGER